MSELIYAAQAGRAADVAALLADGADVNERSAAADGGCTALYIACQDRHTEVVTTLLAANANVDQANSNGTKPLHIATAKGHAEVVTTLLAASANINQADNGGATPLSLACRLGHTEVVTKLLAASPNMNQAANDGCTPLYMACFNGHTEVVTKLLAANASVRQARKDGGFTPLYAASQKGHTEVVTKLLAANADVNQAENRGIAPLYTACEFAEAEVVAKLLAANADVNQARDNGATPLLIACHEGHLRIVQLLSSYGARRTFPFPAPEDTAESLATERGHIEIVAWLRETRLLTTPLHHLEFITAERARELLRAGADIYARAVPLGPTPLSVAQAAAMGFLGGAAEGTAAFLVLEAAKPWSRYNHKLFPAAARARAVDLMLVGELLSRKERFAAYGPQAVVDVWMTFVIPNAVGRDYSPRVDAEEALLRRLAALGFSVVGDA